MRVRISMAVHVRICRVVMKGYILHLQLILTQGEGSITAPIRLPSTTCPSSHSRYLSRSPLDTWHIRLAADFNATHRPEIYLSLLPASISLLAFSISSRSHMMVALLGAPDIHPPPTRGAHSGAPLPLADQIGRAHV